MGRCSEVSRIIRIVRIHTNASEAAPRRSRSDWPADGTGEIIGAFYSVYNELRYGFLESVYAGALEVEFQARELPYVRELPLDVRYKGRIVGTYRADFFVGGNVIVEVKATRQLADAARRQLLHYLRATDQEIGLLLHFGPKAEFQRMVHSRVQ